MGAVVRSVAMFRRIAALVFETRVAECGCVTGCCAQCDLVVEVDDVSSTLERWRSLVA
jgi:hypothetical protein